MATDCYKTIIDIQKLFNCDQNAIEVINYSQEHDAPIALGLDFGLNLGFAYGIYSKSRKKWYILPEAIGVLDLHTGRYESGSTCFLKLRNFLNTIKPSIVFYEDVKFTPSFAEDVSPGVVVSRVATSAELLSSLRQTCLLWAEDYDVPFIPIPLKAIPTCFSK